MRIGQRVRLNPDIEHFVFGQGSVGYGEIGIIKSIDGENVIINFPSHHSWAGIKNELISMEHEASDEKIICSECGEKITGDYIENDGDFICEDCFEENYFYCDECGCVELKDNGYWVESNERFVCEDCLNNEYSQCDECGEYFRNDEGCEVHNIYGDTNFICGRCYSNGNYFCCENCGEYYDIDCMHEHEYSYYCDDCYEEQGGGLYGYHEFQDWELFKGKNEENPKYYIGKEIELEPKESSDVKGVLEAIKNINAVGMHDGSLRDGGVEVVSHPESWEYLQEHKQDYIKFFEEIKELNYGNAGGCGLHFHVSRPNDDVIARVIVLLESFKEEIKRLSRRSDGQLRSWAKFLSDDRSENEKIKYQSTKWLKEKYVKQYHDRYYALNLSNDSTIEFRFFNGVNTFEQYWAALQFIHNIMELALDEKREIKTINWQDLLIGEELKEQARKRDVLEINKFAKDTNEIIENLEKALEKAKTDISRTLKNLAKYINKEMSEMDLKQIKTSNVDDISEKITSFMNTFNYRRQYLEKVTTLYNYLKNNNDLDIKNVKDYWDNVKSQYPTNTKRYARYGKMIEKTIKDYESEVR